VVSVYINTMKTTFNFNFDLNQAIKQHGDALTKMSREAVNSKSFYLITCKLGIQNKLVINQNFSKKVVFIVLI